MRSQSTKVVTSKQGSTEPVALPQRLQQEAADIKQLWHSHGPRSVQSQFVSREKLMRHKSLVLKLILDDYVKVTNQISCGIALEQYCEQFSGLGESLEQSIYDQLKIMEYLQDHPEMLDVERDFVWPEAGDRFHNFLVLEELGHGALARVYLCRQHDLADRLVVVKITLWSRAEEASLLAKLRHPNVMPIYWAAHDEQNHASYLCMPFAGRSTLADLIDHAFREGAPRRAQAIFDAANRWILPHDREALGPPMPSTYSMRSGYIEGVLQLAFALADGLSFAHSQGVIHGDIKPSNVLVTPDGNPILFDFNLGRDEWQCDGPAGGTIAYMAPEQLLYLAEGDALAFPPPQVSTDVYSFGVLLCELISGRHPYDFDDGPGSPKLAAQRLYCQQVSLSIDSMVESLRLSDSLRKLLLDCLAVEPQLRPSSMGEVRDRLANELKLLAKARRLVRAYPRLVLFASVVALIGSIVAVIALATRPSLAESHFNAGIAAARLGNWSAGAEAFGKVAELDSTNTDARLQLARCRTELGDYSIAADECLLLIRQAPDPRAMALLAYCSNFMSKPVIAAQWYEEAMKRGLRSAGIQNNLSVNISMKEALTRDRDSSRSQLLLLNALKLAPDSPVIHMNIARLCVHEMSRGNEANLDSAISSIDWLCRNCPNDPQVWETAFLLHGHMADKNLSTAADALKYLRKAIDLGGGPSWEQLRSGLKYARYRQLPEYAAILKAALARTGTSNSEEPIGQFLFPLSDSELSGTVTASI